MANYTKPVIFRLGAQNFGVDINLVQSIERQINVVRVPNAMNYISGIVNLRGEVIPAYSLRKKFGIDDSVGSVGEDSTVIVNIPNTLKLALEVDEVLEIGAIDENGIVPMPVIAKTEETGYLDRVVSVGGNLVILLDIEKLLTQSEADSVKKFAEEMNNDDGGAHD